MNDTKPIIKLVEHLFGKSTKDIVHMLMEEYNYKRSYDRPDIKEVQDELLAFLFEGSDILDNKEIAKLYVSAVSNGFDKVADGIFESICSSGKCCVEDVMEAMETESFFTDLNVETRNLIIDKFDV